MAQLKSIRRVTIYADSSLERDLIAQCLKMGAHGYTIIECKGGKGVQGVLEDPFSTPSSRVCIEVLVDPEIGDQILDFFSNPQFDKYAILVCMDPVEVGVREHY
jgi:hypothetical protein